MLKHPTCSGWIYHPDKQAGIACYYPSTSLHVGPSGRLWGFCGYHFAQAQQQGYRLHPAFGAGSKVRVAEAWEAWSEQLRARRTARGAE